MRWCGRECGRECVHAVVWGGSSCDDGLAVVQRDQVQELQSLDPTAQQHTRHETALPPPMRITFIPASAPLSPLPTSSRNVIVFFAAPVAPFPKLRCFCGSCSCPPAAAPNGPLSHTRVSLQLLPLPSSGGPFGPLSQTPAPAPAQQRQESKTETSLPPPTSLPTFRSPSSSCPCPAAASCSTWLCFGSRCSRRAALRSPRQTAARPQT